MTNNANDFDIKSRNYDLLTKANADGRDLSKLDAELAALKKDNDKLRAERDQLKNDPKLFAAKEEMVKDVPAVKAARARVATAEINSLRRLLYQDPEYKDAIDAHIKTVDEEHAKATGAIKPEVKAEELKT